MTSEFKYFDGYYISDSKAAYYNLDGTYKDKTGIIQSFVNGKLHKSNGPAVEWPDGSSAWYINGKLHIIDGAAYETDSGYKSWYIDGNSVTHLEHKLLYDTMKLKGLL